MNTDKRFTGSSGSILFCFGIFMLNWCCRLKGCRGGGGGGHCPFQWRFKNDQVFPTNGPGVLLFC